MTRRRYVFLGRHNGLYCFEDRSDPYRPTGRYYHVDVDRFWGRA
jgi:hypothetical protein